MHISVLHVLLQLKPAVPRAPAPSAAATLAQPAAMTSATLAVVRPVAPVHKTVHARHLLQKRVVMETVALLQAKTAPHVVKTVANAQKPVVMDHAIQALVKPLQTVHSTVVGKSAAMDHAMQALVKTATTAKPTVVSALAAATVSALWGKTVPTALQTVQHVPMVSVMHQQKAAQPVQPTVVPVS